MVFLREVTRFHDRSDVGCEGEEKDKRGTTRFVATLSFHLLGWGGQGEELLWGWRGSIGAQVGAHKVWAVLAAGGIPKPPGWLQREE